LTFSFIRPFYREIIKFLPASVCFNAQGAFPCKIPFKKEME